MSFIHCFFVAAQQGATAPSGANALPRDVAHGGSQAASILLDPRLLNCYPLVQYPQLLIGKFLKFVRV